MNDSSRLLLLIIIGIVLYFWAVYAGYLSRTDFSDHLFAAFSDMSERFNDFVGQHYQK